MDEPTSAEGDNGKNFRVTIAAERFDAQEGPMAVVTVREFLGDVDAILRSLRQPIVVA